MLEFERVAAVVFAVGCLACGVGWARAARELARVRRTHSAHTARLAWAEWWGKNALEFREGHPTREALQTFALLALRAPSFHLVIRELQHVARPERDLGLTDEKGPSGLRQWFALAQSRARCREDSAALELVNRAGEALDEVRLGSPHFDVSKGEIKWLVPAPYEDSVAGGAWAVRLLERETIEGVRGVREFAFRRIGDLLSHETTS
jgi:hypothetical protein